MRVWGWIGLVAMLGGACDPLGSSGPENGGSSQQAAPSRSASGAIEVVAPARGAEIGSPLPVRGRAKVSEGKVHFRLRAGPRQLAEGVAEARMTEEGQFVPFEGSLSWQGEAPGTRAELEVFAIRQRDGVPDHVVTIPLLLH